MTGFNGFNGFGGRGFGRFVRNCFLLASIAGMAACGGSGVAPITRTPPDAPTRDEYVESLKDFDLDRSALGRDWMQAGDRALAEPVAAGMPFSESGYFAPATPAAVGYRVALRRGRKLVVDVTFDSAQPAQLFIDLFELAAAGEDRPPRRVAEVDPGARRLEYEVRRDADHVLRIQPELLRGGRYHVVQRTEASLAFPVQGQTLRASTSGFGAPRDAGRRSHHGIDIFAPRGTPVIAAADGTIRVDTSNLGGQVIWLRDAAVRRSLYYAHLDGWAVENGAVVKAGDVIGYVGNTGNARTTPPHLHFGVYDRGPTDPYPFLQPADAAPPRIAGTAALFGTWARVTRRGAPLRQTASVRSPVQAMLDPNTAIEVVAASAGFYRVRLPDGTDGYVVTTDAVATTQAVRPHRTAAPVPLQEAPTATAPRMALVDSGTRVDVLATFGAFDLVRLADQQIGWLLRPIG